MMFINVCVMYLDNVSYGLLWLLMYVYDLSYLCCVMLQMHKCRNAPALANAQMQKCTCTSSKCTNASAQKRQLQTANAQMQKCKWTCKCTNAEMQTASANAQMETAQRQMHKGKCKCKCTNANAQMQVHKKDNCKLQKPLYNMLWLRKSSGQTANSFQNHFFVNAYIYHALNYIYYYLEPCVGYFFKYTNPHPIQTITY